MIHVACMTTDAVCENVCYICGLIVYVHSGKQIIDNIYVKTWNSFWEVNHLQHIYLNMKYNAKVVHDLYSPMNLGNT